MSNYELVSENAGAKREPRAALDRLLGRCAVDRRPGHPNGAEHGTLVGIQETAKAQCLSGGQLSPTTFDV